MLGACQAPCFASTREHIQALWSTEEWPTLRHYEAHLERAARASGALGVDTPGPYMRCEPDASLKRRRRRRPRAELYDAQITERGVIPSRTNNWHDLFNLVAWAAFPQAKRALHARQYRRLCERVGPEPSPLPGTRTAEQDALTHLDEGGLLILTPPPTTAAHALSAASHRREHAVGALDETLAQLAQARVPLQAEHLAPYGAQALLFGHALMEHLALGAPAPRAAVVFVEATVAEVDLRLAERLHDDTHAFRCARGTAWVTAPLTA